MRNCKKMFAMFAVVLTLLSVMVTTAFATTTKPYGSYNTTLTVVSGKEDVAKATITRCSCLKVDNYLAAYLRYQYRDGNNYIEVPANNYFYVNKGENIETASVTKSEHYIYWVHGVYYARCGTGTQKMYSQMVERP